jgi:hypothetical protein
MKRRVGTISFKKKQRIGYETKYRDWNEISELFELFHFFFKKNDVSGKTKDRVWNEGSDHFFFLKKKRSIRTETKYRNYFLFLKKKETKYRNYFFFFKKFKKKTTYRVKRRIGTISFFKKKKRRIGSETKDRNYFIFFKKETKYRDWNEGSELFLFF